MTSDQHAQTGTLGEEATKLLGVLAAAGEQASADQPSDCSYCPVCQAIGFVRAASPETLEHLSASVSSLALAARSLLDSLATHGHHTNSSASPTGTGFENIDVTDDEGGFDRWD